MKTSESPEGRSEEALTIERARLMLYLETVGLLVMFLFCCLHDVCCFSAVFMLCSVCLSQANRVEGGEHQLTFREQQAWGVL